MDIDIKIRIDTETMEKIDSCKEKLNTTRSDVLRKGVHLLYETLEEK